MQFQGIAIKGFTLQLLDPSTLFKMLVTQSLTANVQYMSSCFCVLWCLAHGQSSGMHDLQSKLFCGNCSTSDMQS